MKFFSALRSPHLTIKGARIVIAETAAAAGTGINSKLPLAAIPTVSAIRMIWRLSSSQPSQVTASTAQGNESKKA